MHWIDGVSEETLRHVLKTIHYILDDADKELTETELNKLHYCWDIINHIQHFEVSKETNIDTNQTQLNDNSSSNISDSLRMLNSTSIK